jgi:DNA polymerase
MLVGEIPGDEEDRQGRPFVGPAGRLLDQVLEEAGINRRDSYVTNIVKHCTESVCAGLEKARRAHQYHAMTSGTKA